MGMPFLVDDGVVIELNWDQMAMMSLAQTAIHTTRLLSLDNKTLIEIEELHNEKNQNG